MILNSTLWENISRNNIRAEFSEEAITVTLCEPHTIYMFFSLTVITIYLKYDGTLLISFSIGVSECLSSKFSRRRCLQSGLYCI